MNKYPPTRIRGLSGPKLKGKTFEEVFGPEVAKAMKEKMRQAKLGRKMPWNSVPERKGAKAPNWKGGVSRAYKTGYNSIEYKSWRKSVFERDAYTCQHCDVKGSSSYLTAHHIKSFAHYPELRFELSNGLTLCESCHSKTDNYKGRTNRKSRA